MKEKYSKFYITFIIAIALSLISCKLLLKAENDGKNTANYLYDLSVEYNKIESYEAKVTVISGDGRNDLEQTGIFYYKKPYYYRLELYIDSNMQDLIIKNRKYRWHYAKWLNTVFKYNMIGKSEQKMDLLDIVIDYSKQKNMTYLGKKQMERESLHAFTGEFKNQKDSANITFYLQDNGIIKMVEMIDTQEDFRIIKKFSDIQINVPLKESLFEFSTPNGIRIIDKTQE